MSCHGCKCYFCARSCELYAGYVTVGEITDVALVCYTCDECRYYDGDHQKRSQWRGECSGYMEARKYTEARAAALRGKFRVIKGDSKT